MKAISITIVSIFFILAFSCTETRKNKIPDDVISKTDLVPILIDIHIAEASVSFSGLNKDSFDYYISNYYFSIFTKYDLSKEKFQRSMDFYLDHPNIFQEVYEVVNDSIQNLQVIQPE